MGEDDATWRLRWYVVDLAHHTVWTMDFATVENLYVQYRQSGTHPGHDYAIERRTPSPGRPRRASDERRHAHRPRREVLRPAAGRRLRARVGARRDDGRGWWPVTRNGSDIGSGSLLQHVHGDHCEKERTVQYADVVPFGAGFAVVLLAHCKDCGAVEHEIVDTRYPALDDEEARAIGGGWR